MTDTKVKTVKKKSRETLLKNVKEMSRHLKKLKYYEDLDNKGKVIHPFLKEKHTTAVDLFYKIMGKIPADFKFKKTDKKQLRDIGKYNYEVNFQKYCGGLAREYKRLTGNNPQKFTKNKIWDEEKNEEQEEYIRDNIESERQEESILEHPEVCKIADKKKHTGGSSMYPLTFKSKKNETIRIIDIARKLLNTNPPSDWFDDIVLINQKEIMTCECGVKVQRGSMKSHMNTQKHKKLILKL